MTAYTCSNFSPWPQVLHLLCNWGAERQMMRTAQMRWSWGRPRVWRWWSSWRRCGKKSVSTNIYLQLMKALVWFVMRYGWEALTLKKDEERRIQASENKCIQKLLRIPRTNLLKTEISLQDGLAGTESELQSHSMPKRRKVWYFGHVMRIRYNADDRPCGRSEKPQKLPELLTS